MSTHPLYQAVREQLDAHLPIGWRASLRGSLSLLVMGIMEGKCASPSGIARALARLGLSAASEESLERRVRRIENTPELTATVCFHPFAKHHLLLGKPRQLVLAIDPTTHTDTVVLLTISVIYRGRALPLLWMLWEANQPLEGASFWERVAALLEEVASLLPAGIPVIWLADRAFGSPQFTDLVAAHGWHYVVRVQGQTRCQDRGGVIRPLSSLVADRGQRRKLRGPVFKKHGWRTASVVVWWGRNHPAPLCLVSNLPPDWCLVKLYRRRYTIEAGFRDFKSAGWHWEQTQVRDLDHLNCLLIGMALATWMTIMVGVQVAREYLDQAPTGLRRTLPWIAKRSLFQLGLQRLDRWLHRLCHQPLAWCLSDWEAPDWQQQVYQHHARAFVFRSHGGVC